MTCHWNVRVELPGGIAGRTEATFDVSGMSGSPDDAGEDAATAADRFIRTYQENAERRRQDHGVSA